MLTSLRVGIQFSQGLFVAAEGTGDLILLVDVGPLLFRQFPIKEDPLPTSGSQLFLPEIGVYLRVPRYSRSDLHFRWFSLNFRPKGPTGSEAAPGLMDEVVGTDDIFATVFASDHCHLAALRLLLLSKLSPHNTQSNKYQIQVNTSIMLLLIGKHQQQLSVETEV